MARTIARKRRPAHTAAVREITCRDLHRRLTAGEPVYLIDVREPWENRLAALPGSVLVPLGELAGRAGELAPPPGALVVAYCHHGVRSLRAALLLDRAGLGPVLSLAGGIDRWSAEIDPAVQRY
jgi:adenylyltransferase/sulfurtransferase